MTTCLIAENERLRAEVAAANATIAQMQRTIDSLQQTVQWQRREMEDLLKKYVVRKTIEVPNVNQPIFSEIATFFDQAIAAASEQLDEPPRDDNAPPPAGKGGGGKGKDRKRHRGRQLLPAHLERRTTVLDIPEDEKIDPLTGKELVEIRREVTEKLDVIPAKMLVNRIERPVYALPKGKGIEIAPLPEHVLGKSLVDTGFLADMEIKRFIEHVPFDRQSKSLELLGIDFHRNDLDLWHLKIADEAKPLADAIIEKILAGSYVGFDDTGIKIRQRDAEGQLRTSRIWACRAGVGPPLVGFRFSLTKESEEAVNLLGNFKGFAQADAASNHNAVMLRDGVIECGCWAHGVRKFKEAAPAHPVKAEEVLHVIGQLYDIEAEIRGKPPEYRLAQRQARAKPLMTKLYAIFDRLKLEVLPKSPLAAAINYCLNQKEPLLRYLEDGRVDIDNNASERALRPWGRGRINWLFFASERGGRAAAIIMTLICSARNLGINPWLYLKDILDRLPTHPKDRMHELIPGAWRPLPQNENLGIPMHITPAEAIPFRAA